LDFSSDGNYLASGAANGSAKVIDIAGLHETFPYEETGLVNSVALEGSPPAAGASGHLLAISAGGAISLWDGGTGELHSVLGGHGSEVEAMDFSPNGELLASGGQDGELKIWDVVTGEEMAAYFLEGAIRRVVFSSDGTLLAATTLEGPVWIWAVGAE
jgi:WD40 repeat protein